MPLGFVRPFMSQTPRSHRRSYQSSSSCASTCRSAWQNSPTVPSSTAFPFQYRPDRTAPSCSARTILRGLSSQRSSDHEGDSTGIGGPQQQQPERSETNRKHTKKKRSKRGTRDGQVYSPRELERANYLVEEETREWVRRVVVGLNLCPFAAKPLADEHLFITVVRGDDLEDILRHILVQSLVFVEDDDDDDTENTIPGTALVVCPDLVPHDFHEYLNVLTMVVDGLLEDHDLVGRVQVVPFHPQFVFGGDDNNDDNGDPTEHNHNKLEYWTNRSPYPMFHILKEADVSRAIELVHGNTDKIWQRNVHLLQRLEELAEENSWNDDEESLLDNDTKDPGTKRQVLEAYLRSGNDTKEGTATSLVKQALDEMSKEFPLLQRPISSEDEDGDGDEDDEEEDETKQS